MSSICLNHKDRETDIRCAACLRPICSECVVLGPSEGRYCSQDCIENAKKSSERFADMYKRDEKALHEARAANFAKVMMALGLLLVLGVVLWIAWPSLPPSVTSPVHGFLEGVQDLLKF